MEVFDDNPLEFRKVVQEQIDAAWGKRLQNSQVIKVDCRTNETKETK